MNKTFQRPKSLRDRVTHYCPGCGHGIIHRIVCEVIDELDVREKTIAVAPVGCAVIAYDYWDFDVSEAPHGRAPAVATGIKRARPDNVVFSYQGDGDLSAIGTAEIIHTANRAENITVIFVNNAIYGMTGGQMAPTTLIGQKTQTSPKGRDIKRDGYPLRISEMLAVLDGAKYIERTSIHDIKNINNTKTAIKKAFQNQLDNTGFSLVEVLSACPTCWGMPPKDALKWIKEDMVSYYPLGKIK